jgi:hypothetical protein
VLDAKLPIAHLAISTHRAGDEGPASPLAAADARIQCEQTTISMFNTTRSQHFGLPALEFKHNARNLWTPTHSEGPF